MRLASFGNIGETQTFARPLANLPPTPRLVSSAFFCEHFALAELKFSFRGIALVAMHDVIESGDGIGDFNTIRQRLDERNAIGKRKTESTDPFSILYGGWGEGA